jgi:hypothetical protein
VLSSHATTWLEGIDWDADGDIDLLSDVGGFEASAGGLRSSEPPSVLARVRAGVAVPLSGEAPRFDRLLLGRDTSFGVAWNRAGTPGDRVELAAAGTTWFATTDVNADARLDVVALIDGELVVFENQGHFALERKRLSFETNGALRVHALADFDNDGYDELFATSQTGAVIVGFDADGATSVPIELAGVTTGPLETVVSADWNGDGRLDMLALSTTGILQLLELAEAAPAHFIDVELATRQGHAAPGALVEVRAGSLRRVQLAGAEPLRFGLGAETRADVVRVTWPDGMVEQRIGERTDRRLRIRQALQTPSSWASE